MLVAQTQLLLPLQVAVPQSHQSCPGVQVPADAGGGAGSKEPSGGWPPPPGGASGGTNAG